MKKRARQESEKPNPPLKKPKKTQKAWDIARWRRNPKDNPVQAARRLMTKFGPKVSFTYKGIDGILNLKFPEDLVKISWPDCFKIRVDDKGWSEIDAIQGNRCRNLVHSTVTGSYLVELAIQILCKLGANAIYLDDASSITCKGQFDRKGEERRFPLYLYYILIHGRTWYSKFGFTPSEDQHRWDGAIDRLRSLKLSRMSNCLTKGLHGKASELGVNLQV